MNKDFNHSYWEIKHLFKKYELIIIGSGIVGLSTAISYKLRHKKDSVLILEAGSIPNGASTKNAGFACFGSAGEIIEDLKNYDEQRVWETIEMRYKGLNLLRKRLGDKQIDFKDYGGYELFEEKEKYEACLNEVASLNKNFKQILGINNCYKPIKKDKFGFKHNAGLIKNNYEGQIDTGLMMKNLTEMALQHGVNFLFNCKVAAYTQLNNGVVIKTNLGEFTSSKLVVATNGFAKTLIPELDVNPARAQVLITKKIKQLKIKGTFHFDEGYYYFRNIDNRILFGGGRNLDFKTENTAEFKLNHQIQKKLDALLKKVILPDTAFEVEHRWTGIMGLGKEKKPIIQHHSNDVIVAVRMGGMGIAIGTWVGEEVVKLI